jgi:hypothetical protein
MLGTAVGNRSRVRICHFDAPKDFIMSTCSELVELKPSVALMRTGKKAMSAVVKIFNSMPNPNHTRNSGASATLGTVCRTTMIGRNAFSARRDELMTTATTMPATTAIANPRRISWRVTHVCSHRGPSVNPVHSASATLVGAGSTMLEMSKTRTHTSQTTRRARTASVARRTPGRSETRRLGAPAAVRRTVRISADRFSRVPVCCAVMPRPPYRRGPGGCGGRSRRTRAC